MTDATLTHWMRHHAHQLAEAAACAPNMRSNADDPPPV